MADIIKRINREIRELLGDEDVSESTTLTKYMKYATEKRLIDIVFSSADTEGTLSMVDGDVTVVLPSCKYMEHGISNSTYATAGLLGITMQVSVYEIDSEAKKVYVEIAGTTQKLFAPNMRKEIAKELGKSLSAGKHPVVWGRIQRVSRDKLLVNILDKGVLGFLHKKDWSTDFIRSLESVCKEGDFFQFEVLGQATKVEGKESAWILGRKGITVSAWSYLDVEGLKDEGILLVKCIEKPNGKTYWWGTSERLPGIELMGDYTAKFPDINNLYVGITYKCKIKRIDLDKRKISIIPFEVIASDIPRVENIRYAQGKIKTKDNVRKEES